MSETEFRPMIDTGIDAIFPRPKSSGSDPVRRMVLRPEVSEEQLET